MAREAKTSGARGAGAFVALFPIIGLLAVGNLVFALLWLLNPLAGGPSGGPSGRRIEVRTEKRLLRIGDGLSAEEPNTGLETRISGEQFEERLKLLIHLTRMTRTGDQAAEFFESDFGRSAQPAVTFTFPLRGGTSETLDVFAIDLRRQAVYCRLRSTGEALAIKLDQYQKIAADFAQLSGGVAGSLAVPYYMPVDDAVRSRLAKLQAPLAITTVSSDPRQHLLRMLGGRMAAAGGLQFSQPDRSTLILTLRLPDDQAMARGLADGMARASENVKVQHLDFATQAEAVRELARAIKRAPGDIEDALVLQYGGRVNVIRGTDLLGQDDTGPLLAVATRFEGMKVIAQALDDLLSERGLFYFAEGHGERRLADRREEGLSQAAEHLAARFFRTAALDLATAKALPDDCHALVIPGPRKPYPAELEKAIGDWLERGGRLAVLLDPPEGVVPISDTLKRFGITVPEPKKPLEVPGRLNPPVAIELELNTKVDFVAKWTREPVVFFTAVELAIAAAAADAPLEVLRIARPADAEGGAKAPCLIAAVRPKAGQKGPKLLVFSDVDAFSNQLLRQLATNVQLLTDALNWLGD